MLLNISADSVENATLMLRTTVAGVTLTDMRCRETAFTATGRDGPYARFALPKLAPWESVLLIGDKGNVLSYDRKTTLPHDTTNPRQRS